MGLQKAGYDTLLLEKQKNIGATYKKIDITEDLYLYPILKKYNIKPQTISNISFWHAGDEYFKFKSKIKDLFFIRGNHKESLEKQLFNQASSEGLDTIFSAKVKIKNNKIFINNKEINSKIIIGADGIDSIITKYYFPHEKYRIIEGYGRSYKNLNIPIGETHIFFEQSFVPGGYIYLGKTKSLGTIILGGLNKLNDNYFKKITQNNLKLSSIIGKRKGSEIWGKGIISNINKRVYKNTILVGDAARVSDPLFLYGLRPALISGDLAVKTILEYLENGNNLHNYDNLLKYNLLQDYSLLNIVRNTFEKSSQKDIEFIIKNLKFIDDNIGIDKISEKSSNILKTIMLLYFKNPFYTTKIGYKAIKSLIETF